MNRLILLLALTGCPPSTEVPEMEPPTPSSCSPGVDACALEYEICVEIGPPYSTWAEFEDGHVVECVEGGGCFEEQPEILGYCDLRWGR